jgi:HNH endonuclease
MRKRLVWPDPGYRQGMDARHRHHHAVYGRLHHMGFYNTTNPRPLPELTPKQIERFWSRVQKTDDPDGCWIWTGRTIDGYGYFDIGDTAYAAQRISYSLTRKPIPERMVVDHLCRNPICINPDHLEPVRSVVNVLRGVGFSAQNNKKTHCPQGHPLSGDNLCLYEDRRYCRACMKEHKRRYREKNRESLRIKASGYNKTRGKRNVIS